MKSQRDRSQYRLILILCCLVPLAALAATLFLDTPIALTALVAIVVLIPLAERLLAAL